MRREYIDSMKAKGFGDFIAACDELRSCKYILAENKIAALLKAIADNKQLYSMFAASLYNFDYQATFDECVMGSCFSLPSEPQKVVALVFRILVDLDSGKMPLQNFLEAYFYGESINDAYARFGLEVIAPFETYCRLYFTQTNEQTIAGVFAELENPRPPQSGSIVVTENRLPQAAPSAGERASERFQSDLKNDAIEQVKALIDIADGAIIGQVDNAEYVTCLNGLLVALESRGYKDIIPAFLGVKYAVAYFFKNIKTVSDIFKRLDYDIKNLMD